MSITLLKLDNDTTVNINYILEITVENLNKLRQERRQHHQTQEQRERLKDKFWEVSVYFRSDSNGYNPQRYTKRFQTQQEANNWITTKFGGSIVNSI